MSCSLCRQPKEDVPIQTQNDLAQTTQITTNEQQDTVATV